jgi:hypothetical protein
MAISKFTVVTILGVDDNKPSVEPWSPNSYEHPANTTSPKILGVTMTDSEYLAPVAVMRRGYLRDVTPATGSWSVGDLLWAQADSTVHNTRPAGPLPQVFIGTVFDSTGGSAPYVVEVNVTVLPNIGELSGVDRQTPSDLEVLIFKESTQVWEPRPLDYGNRSTLMHPFLFMGGS